MPDRKRTPSVKGPTRPTNIIKIIIALPGVVKPPVMPVDKPTVPGRHLAGRVGVVRMKRFDGPALGGDLGDGVRTRPQKVGKTGEIGRSARSAERHADDGDGLPPDGLCAGKLRLECPNLDQCAFDGR